MTPASTRPARYPIPTRGTTLGRACTTCGFAPPRPIIPAGIPAPDVLTASDFWGGAGSAACQGFITQLGRNFQVIYEQANAHGQKVQAAGNNMAQTDSAVGSSWA